jgi:hypothetical protein
MSFKVSKSHLDEPGESESFFPKAMDGLSHEEVGKVLGDLGNIGGIHDTHALIEAAGLTRDLDKTSARWNEAIKAFPVIVDRTIKDGVSSLKDSQSKHQNDVAALAKDIQSSIDKSTAEIKQSLAAHDAQLKKSRTSKGASALVSGIDVKSLLIGAASATMLVVPLCWFAVVPYMVSLENGSDWALKKYYNSPEGRHAREVFKVKCNGVYPCKTLKK